MKKIICLLLSLFIITSCRSYETTSKSFDSSKDIVIIYSYIFPDSDENVGDIYLKIKDTKKSILENTPNVTLVEAGSNQYVDKANDAGYDYACLSPNVLCDGLDAAYNYIKQAKYKYLLCSASYNGQKKDVFKKTTPYEIVDYGGIKVGYIGAVSPEYISALSIYYTEDDKTVINFYDETEEVFYDTVQCSIDKAKAKGADYIVLLSQFDEDTISNPYSLHNLISNLSYVDVVINCDDYSKQEEFKIKNKDNEDVLIVSNGKDGIKIGQVIINNDSIINKEIN